MHYEPLGSSIRSFLDQTSHYQTKEVGIQAKKAGERSPEMANDFSGKKIEPKSKKNAIFAAEKPISPCYP